MGLFRILGRGIRLQTPWFQCLLCRCAGGFGSQTAGPKRLGPTKSQRHVPQLQCSCSAGVVVLVKISRGKTGRIRLWTLDLHPAIQNLAFPSGLLLSDNDDRVPQPLALKTAFASTGKLHYFKMPPEKNAEMRAKHFLFVSYIMLFHVVSVYLGSPNLFEDMF